MAGRNHDAAIEIIHPGDVSSRRRSSDVQQVGICAGGGQTGNQTILEHIRAAAGVLADYNVCRLVVAVALTPVRCNTSPENDQPCRRGQRSELFQPHHGSHQSQNTFPL